MVGSERRSSLLAEKQADTFQLAKKRDIHTPPMERRSGYVIVRNYLSAEATFRSREYACDWDCDIP